MYPALRDVADGPEGGRRFGRRSSRGVRTRVPLAVVLLGITSMLTDISSEMVTAVLPLYLTFELSFTAFQFGLYEGLSQGLQAVMRLVGGAAADRRSGHKGLALIGYGSSAITRLAILLTGGAWVPTTGVLLVDKMGKGVRTAPRDAMISLASEPESMGRSFGVHRSLDALGALIGPLLAFAILAMLPGSYDTVFIVSFSFAIVGVAVLGLFVERQPRRAPHEGGFRRVVMRQVVRNRSLRRVAFGATLLGLLTVSDAFIFLGYRRVADVRLEFFPLLFTGTAVVFLVFAVPVGRLADRIGRRIVFMGGYAVLGLVYIALLRPPPGVFGLVVVLGGLGLFYAATDGVLMAAASEMLGVDTRATGLAVVATGIAAGRFVASIAFGGLWSLSGPGTAFAVFAAAIPVALVAAWFLMSNLATMGEMATGVEQAGEAGGDE
nr:putative MFS transporter [uncultured bacterium]